MKTNHCIHLKQKFNRTLFCKKKNKTITFKDCNSCKFKEYKSNSHQIKKKTNKLSKLEKNRKSIFTTDLTHCIICGRKKEHLHEIFFGKNRLNSIKYNLIIPLCFSCHSEMHKNIEWQNYWHKKGQLAFIKSYPDLDFIDIFKTNYLGGVKNEK